MLQQDVMPGRSLRVRVYCKRLQHLIRRRFGTESSSVDGFRRCLCALFRSKCPRHDVTIDHGRRCLSRSLRLHSFADWYPGVIKESPCDYRRAIIGSRLLPGGPLKPRVPKRGVHRGSRGRPTDRRNLEIGVCTGSPGATRTTIRQHSKATSRRSD